MPSNPTPRALAVDHRCPDQRLEVTQEPRVGVAPLGVKLGIQRLKVEASVLQLGPEVELAQLLP